MLSREHIKPGETFVRVDYAASPVENGKVCLVHSWSHSPDCVRLRRPNGEFGIYNLYWLNGLHEADFRVGDHVKIKDGQFVYAIEKIVESASGRPMAVMGNDQISHQRHLTDLVHVGWDVPVTVFQIEQNAIAVASTGVGGPSTGVGGPITPIYDFKEEAGVISQLRAQRDGLEELRDKLQAQIARLETENTNLASTARDWKDKLDRSRHEHAKAGEERSARINELERKLDFYDGCVRILRKELEAAPKTTNPPESYLTIGLRRAWTELSAVGAGILYLALCALKAPWKVAKSVATRAWEWKKDQFKRSTCIGSHVPGACNRHEPDGTVCWIGSTVLVFGAMVVGFVVNLPILLYAEHIEYAAWCEANRIVVRPGPTLEDPRERAWFREVQRQRQAAAKKLSWQ